MVQVSEELKLPYFGGFPYAKFLSDLAPGALLLFVLLAAIKYPILGSLLPDWVQTLAGQGMEQRVPIYVLLGLLMIPLGYSINFLSCMLLGGLVHRMEVGWACSRNKLIRSWTQPTKQSFQFARVKRHYGLSRENWFDRTQMIERAVAVYDRVGAAQYSRTDGLRILFRSVALVLGGLGVASCVAVGHVSVRGGGNATLWAWPVAWCVLAFCCVATSAFISFYHAIALGHVAYVSEFGSKNEDLRNSLAPIRS